MTCDASSLRGCVVLVTGGTGLVGKALQNLVEKEGVKEGGGELGRWVFLGSADGDLCDWTATESVFAKHAPTHVIHLAARVGGLFANMSSNLDFLRDNLRMCVARRRGAGEASFSLRQTHDPNAHHAPARRVHRNDNVLQSCIKHRAPREWPAGTTSS